MKEALKLALEALKKCRYRSLTDEIVDPAITAIKEALAQPEQEPDLAEAFRTELDKLSQRNYKLRMENAGLKAQPEQEPLAWMHEWEDGGRVLSLYPRDVRLNDQPKSVRPLVYGDTTPPKRPWVGLKDDEMQALWDRYAHMEMMRAIEAKLKAVNGFLKEKNT